MLTDELKKMMQADIEACEKQLSDKKGSQRLFEALIARYNTVYHNFDKEIIVSGKSSFGDEFDYRPEINSIKEKLKMILVTGILKDENIRSSFINITNSNENNVNINISFEDARQKIEAMTGLSDAETQDALEKVNFIEKVIESKESKKSKWQKLKPILLWVADKSVDIGIALLPLLLKINV